MSPRKPKFKFYLDENFPAPAGKFLQSAGHNVLCATSKKYRSLTDLGQLRIANKTKRIFLALDKDFRSDGTLRGTISNGPGVILVKSSDPTPDKVILILEKYLSRFHERLLKGMICITSVDKFEIIDPNMLDEIDPSN